MAKKAYIGIDTEVPVYEIGTVNVEITDDNISDYFTVNHGSEWWFESWETGHWTSNNGGYSDTTATTELTALTDMEITFTYIWYTESVDDTFSLAVGDAIVEDGVTGSGELKTYTGSLTAGQTVSFEFAQVSSAENNEASFYAMSIATQGKIQVGTEIKSVARNIIGGYIGVDNVARKIKQAYIGIGGVARPCLDLAKLTYYGTITELSQPRYDLAATTVGDYALFGGGKVGDTLYDTVDAYSKSLTRTTPGVLYAGVYGLAATTVGDYALFGGGAHTAMVLAWVYAYDKSLTKTRPAGFSNGKYWMPATTVGDYALFGGGYGSVVVDAYDKSLTRSTPTALIQSKYRAAATTVGDYALFGGGYVDSGTTSYGRTVVEAYDKSLTRTTPTALSEGAYNLAATTVGNYALFGGGYSNGNRSTVNAYDKSLTRTIPTALSEGRQLLSAVTVGNYALFGGGYGSDYSGVVDAYDKSLTRTTPTQFSIGRRDLAATTVGSYALFGGGEITGASAGAVVDVYTV